LILDNDTSLILCDVNSSGDAILILSDVITETDARARIYFMTRSDGIADCNYQNRPHHCKENNPPAKERSFKKR
jgi:hypothetical protein